MFDNLINDFLLSLGAAAVRAFFSLIPKANRSGENLVSIFFNFLGSVVFGVMVGYIINKLDIDYLHTYHDFAVAISTMFGKMLVEKAESKMKKTSIAEMLGYKKIDDKENESKPNAS